MFEDFHSTKDARANRRAITATLVSLIVYGAIGGGVYVYASNRTQAPKEEDSIDITFAPAPEPEPVKPEPRPPPPPKTAAPPPPKDMKVRKVTPPTTDPLKPPDEVPDEKLKEDDPSKGVAVADTGGETDPSGVGTGTPPPEPPPPPPPPAPPPKPAKREPMQLPENATPPQPDPANVAPVYPADKRAAGVEGMVVLKIVVSETGKVSAITVMKGDEPFVTAAINAVKTWRFTPALVDGQPTPVFRIIKIPFKISN